MCIHGSYLPFHQDAHSCLSSQFLFAWLINITYEGEEEDGLNAYCRFIPHFKNRKHRSTNIKLRAAYV